MLAMKPPDARVGMRVKVQEHHRIVERRGLVGKVMGCYGGEEYVVVEVRFPDGKDRLFSPEDLEVVSSPNVRWYLLIGTCYCLGRREYKQMTTLAGLYARRVCLPSGYHLWRTMVISSLCVRRA